MVVHDASRNDGLNAIIWAFTSLPITSGDELILLGVIHQLPSPLKIMSKVDGSGSNSKSKNDGQQRKEEYLKRDEIMFEIIVHAGSSPKTIAAKAAKSLRVTWVVLDRQMKKDKKYFMDKLTCGILRLKRDNTIEKLRGPITMEDKKLPLGKRTTSNEHVSYGEMIPEMSQEGLSPKKTPSAKKATNLVKPEGSYSAGASSCSPPSTDQKSSSASAVSSSSVGTSEVSSCTDAGNVSAICFQQDKNDPKNPQVDTAGEQASDLIPESKDRIEILAFNSGSTYDEQEKQQLLSTSDTLVEGCQKEEKFEYSVCSVCQNKRPSIRLTKDFSYAELYEATNCFSSKNFLSEGGFGSVYEGELKCGMKVAVKLHKDASCQGEKEFKSEVNVLSKARHPNLVMLLGSCSEGTHRLLVYEFVCYGSLDQHLSKHALTWEKRIKIALGAARGLDYLHRIKIIHRDMRPNNILVTHDYESMLGDFGLARIACGDTDETGVVGTLGYVAPEYAESGRVSTKTDVYSFGVVLLQLITGCKTKEKKFEGKTLVEWARPLLEDNNYPDLIDERIVDSHDVHVFQLYHIVNLAEACLKKDPAKRETMTHVVKKLEYIMEAMQSAEK
ncbi:serine/threonine-protein kinase CDG1-like [Cynara cardunculus var. scolymus]|uniref:serine/threonine-protein kinase CDG1-like n=1 Tax=Cynara cardunculus var. scolymus TaxID=59895 RepID=UPI000D62E7CA|nr:serine/threonine-protein kinase CDG1-like [Cynara cardunculus var. scolymus]